MENLIIEVKEEKAKFLESKPRSYKIEYFKLHDRKINVPFKAHTNKSFPKKKFEVSTNQEFY